MKIFLTGATGLLGSRVLELLLKKNHDIWVLIHDQSRLEEFQHKGVHAMVGNAEENGSWLGQLPEEIDITLNLIIPTIPARLSLKQVENEIAPLVFNIGKNVLYASQKTNAKRFYQIADVHCYQNSGIEITEKSLLNRDATDWGRIYMDMFPYLQNQKNMPVTFLMHGLLYDSAGNTRPELPRIAGRFPIVGNGANVLSLTHIEDLAAAISFVIDTNFSQQFLNIVDDKPIPQKDFLKLLALKNQIATVPLPTFLATPALGDILTNTLTTSIHVSNHELKSLGYWLKFPDISSGFAPGTI
ncbi:MAG: NAD(P)-dependent oxidoreductase [bacterium]|nr:NAD(P)-dependent oxidoreductase [bacterium]